MDDAVKSPAANSPKPRAPRMEEAAVRAPNSPEKPAARPDGSAQARGTPQGPRVTYPQAGGGDGTVLPERYGQAALIIDQLLYRAGAAAAGDRYSALNSAAHWDYLKAENDLILEVRRAYLNLLAAQSLA